MNKKSWLDTLFYKIGNQAYDFELQILEQEGKVSKRKKYSQICFNPESWENKKFLYECNQRQILPIEVVLDLENKDQLGPILEELKQRQLKYYPFATGSRGFHIHLFFNRELSEDEKLKIIRFFGTDEQLSSKRHMIALEFAPHWKSGKAKELINGD